MRRASSSLIRKATMLSPAGDSAMTSSERPIPLDKVEIQSWSMMGPIACRRRPPMSKANWLMQPAAARGLSAGDASAVRCMVCPVWSPRIGEQRAIRFFLIADPKSTPSSATPSVSAPISAKWKPLSFRTGIGIMPAQCSLRIKGVRLDYNRRRTLHWLARPGSIEPHLRRSSRRAIGRGKALHVLGCLPGRSQDHKDIRSKPKRITPRTQMQ
jgi:hypothetical protein